MASNFFARAKSMLNGLYGNCDAAVTRSMLSVRQIVAQFVQSGWRAPGLWEKVLRKFSPERWESF
jgi:hypothetical protein